MATTTVPRETLEEGRQPGIQLGERILHVPVDLIDVGENVRADAGDVAELAASIAEHGVLQPIRIREAGDRYQLVYGQRRLLAARQAALERIPAILDTAVKNPDWRTVEQLVENIQRADLNALDQARALKALVDAGLTHDAIAHRLGRSRPWVSNLVGILDVAPKVQELVAGGQLTASHAKALSSLPKREQESIAGDAIRWNESAHQLEERVKRHREYEEQRKAEETKAAAKNAERYAAAIERIEKAIPDKSTPLILTDYYSGGALTKALKKAGYTTTTNRDARNRKDALGCDCTAWEVQGGYNGGVQVYAACVKREHQDAKFKQDRAAAAAEEAKEKRIRDGIRQRIAKDLRTVPELTLRVALWTTFSWWEVNDWVKAHKGDRKKPDAWGALSDLDREQLISETADRLARGFTDRYNVKLDWPAIAEAFGLAAAAAPAEKPARKAKATAS